MSYLRRIRPRRPPQSAPIAGSGQVPNSAGGYAWEVDDWARLRRFLVLGSEGGSYYASERTLTRENAEAVERCLAADGPRAVLIAADRGRLPIRYWDFTPDVLGDNGKLGDLEKRGERLLGLDLNGVFVELLNGVAGQHSPVGSVGKWGIEAAKSDTSTAPRPLPPRN